MAYSMCEKRISKVKGRADRLVSDQNVSAEVRSRTPDIAASSTQPVMILTLLYI